MQVILKDGSALSLADGASALDAAGAISAGLARVSLAARVNGEVRELRAPLHEGDRLELLTGDEADALPVLRHTSSHVLAQAVKRLYPGVKLAIGPAIDTGFYYDFDYPDGFDTDALAKIEAEMKKIIKEALPVERFELPRAEAIAYVEGQGEPYKAELIRDLPEDAVISFYRQGDFTDLCAGPHLPDTGRIKAFKLLSSTGAYWRGDAKRPMLRRIYGTAFASKDALASHLHMLEEAKKRDHRKIGRELELFDLFNEGPGFPFFLPKGMMLRNELEAFWREEHRKAGYVEIRTPIILDEQLWHRSGHWDHYQNNMYFTKIDEGDFALKPMNCPGGMLVYKHKMHSYRDLPERVAEMGLVHRHELSGTLHGLMRVRCFTQDDAHIFMTPEQIESEVIGVLDLIDRIYSVFGFEYSIELSTRPENSMGSQEQWDVATAALDAALRHRGTEFKVNEGDGAFYGPKIDFHLKDCIGRTWQCGTIQLDFQMPERFELEYVGPDGEKHRPVMLHRAIFGSIERFIAILTEQFAGAFPTWLAPVQVKILPITDRQHAYAAQLEKTLSDAGVRIEKDLRNEKIGFKIREAQLLKVPYMLVVGDQESEAGTVAVRSRATGETETMPLDAFLTKIRGEISSRAL